MSKRTKKFTKGQRVIDSELGAGTVVETIKPFLSSKLCVAYMVQFDKTPDARYNMGENPTMVFSSSLRAKESTARRAKNGKKIK